MCWAWRGGGGGGCPAPFPHLLLFTYGRGLCSLHVLSTAALCPPASPSSPTPAPPSTAAPRAFRGCPASPTATVTSRTARAPCRRVSVYKSRPGPRPLYAQVRARARSAGEAHCGTLVHRHVKRIWSTAAAVACLDGAPRCEVRDAASGPAISSCATVGCALMTGLCIWCLLWLW